MLSGAKGIFEQARPGSCAEPFRACYRPASGQAQSSLKLILSGGVSIPSTTMGSEKGKVDVYDLGGRMIRRQTERKEALQGLQPGVYIIGRQKVIIK